ncbi:MAG TPA: hypothetical protein VN894_05300 [Polyangiaceae bacterium]|nr:hypothetical protein [Polyangiaceae bacterium]
MSPKAPWKGPRWLHISCLLLGVTHCGTSDSTAAMQTDDGGKDGTSGSMTAVQPGHSGADAGGADAGADAGGGDDTSGSIADDGGGDGGDGTSGSMTAMKPDDGGGDGGDATADAGGVRAADPDASLTADGPARDAGADAASCRSAGDCARNQLCVSLISCPTLLCSPPVITSACDTNPCDGSAACNPCAALCSTYSMCMMTDAGTMLCGSVPGAGGN